MKIIQLAIYSTLLAVFLLLLLRFTRGLMVVESQPHVSPSPTALAIKKSPAPINSLEVTYNIKVVSVAYYPLSDGKLDTTTVIKDTYGEYPFTLEQIRSRVHKLEVGTLAALTEGSRHFFPQGQEPTLAYAVIDDHEFLETVPLTTKTYNDLPLPDYLAMMTKIDVCHYVDDLGVKEVWLWTYAGTGKAGWESNFSSPGLIDISNSNSNRDPNDLPICAHSYTVYDYNYGRQVTEAVHDHMHQFEAIFASIDYNRFWYEFVGKGKDIKGCGDTHLPPNTMKEYEYDSQKQVESYCDFFSDVELQHANPVDCSTWGCDGLKYFSWWMHHVPSDWWTYVANPDLLFSPTRPPSLK